MKPSKIWLDQAKSYENKPILLERYNQTMSLRPCETSSEGRGELGRVWEALKSAAKGPEMSKPILFYRAFGTSDSGTLLLLQMGCVARLVSSCFSLSGVTG